MLEFVLGTAGSGKTTRLIEKIAQAVEGGGKAVYLTPEQFSFEAERLLYRRLGPKSALQVEVLSFTRLCNSIFRRLGGLAGTVVTPTAKYLLMSVAVEELRETLTLYRRSAANTSFLDTLVTTCSELKTAGITPEKLQGFADSCQQQPLKDKTTELAGLYGAYQALLSRGYTDPDDDLIRACQLLENENFFDGLHVFVDGFTTFMSGEFELLGHIIAQARSVAFAMTADAKEGPKGGMGVFSPVQAAIGRLTRLAEQMGVKTGEAEVLVTLPRYRNKALEPLSRGLFHLEKQEYDHTPQGIRYYQAPDPYREMEWIAAGITGLVREEGYRYREIAVVARETENYLPAVETVFSRYAIPYFADGREDVENMPLVGGVLAAIDAVRSNGDVQMMLALAKSPLMGLEAEDVALLENYCYCWGIRGAAWNGEFSNNPRGMAGPVTEEDAAALGRINTARLRLTEPLAGLRRAVASGNGRSFAAGVFAFLEEVDAGANLVAYAQALPGREQDFFLEESARLWDVLIEILDVFGQVLGAIHMPRKRLCELFRLAVAAADTAAIPQTLDQVLVGQADRIRPGEVRAVFVLGANEGVFPRQAAAAGVFSDRERQQLIDAGLGLSPPSLGQAALEKFYGYFALTLPRERLYLSCSRSDLQGRELLPSVIVSELQALYPRLEQEGGYLPLDRVAGEASAFALFAENFRQDTPLTATLRVYFERKGRGKTVARMERAAHKEEHRLMEKSLARELFGSRMRLSPSRVEKYYSCPFSYFASYGLGLKKRKKAEFNPLESGSVIHNVLQVMVQRHGGKGLARVPREQMEREITEIIEGYLESRIEHLETMPKRFRYLFGRLVGLLARLLEHMGKEFAQSEFEPAAFELPIRQDEGVAPLRLETPDGVPVLVEGVVDRVDIMTKNGVKYVRVVDYKSGKKDFKLHDILYGLNMQMLLYLFTIQEQGSGELAGALGAGVLYMPVKESFLNAGREDGEAELAEKRLKQWRMSGLLLEDEESLRGMEPGLEGVFIPAKLDKKGKLDARSSLASRAEMGRLSEKVRRMVVEMAASLGEGRISAFPVESADYNTCQYCDYRTVCGFEQGDRIREVAKINRSEFFKMLEE